LSKIWNHAILVELTMHSPVQPHDHRCLIHQV